MKRLQTNKFNIGDVVKIIGDYEDDFYSTDFRITRIDVDGELDVRYSSATVNKLFYEHELELKQTHLELETYLDGINY